MLTDGPVLSLQNGLGNHEILQQFVFENSAVGVTTNAVKRLAQAKSSGSEKATCVWVVLKESTCTITSVPKCRIQ